MSLASGNAVNMDGSADPSYRYTMPPLVVKHEGSSKMKKTVFVNLCDVSRAVGRPAEQLLAYLGQSAHAASRVEKDSSKAYIAGHHDPKELQRQIFAFIRGFVTCKRCGNPETSCGLEGSKKSKVLFLTCKSCGARSELDSDDRFTKHLAQRLTQDAAKGHAQVAGMAATTMDSIAQLADAEVDDKEAKKKQRQKCPNSDCGHKTSKMVCGKCGAAISSESDAADDSGHQAVSAHVQQWMKQHDDEDMSSELLVDFDATMKCFDVRSPPAHHFAAVIEAVARDTVAACDLPAEKLQPARASDEASPFIGKWSSLLGDLLARMGEEPSGIDIAISTVKEVVAQVATSDSTKEAIVIGILLSLREHLDTVTDESILSACCRLPARSKAMEKFMEFLESDDEEDENDTS